MNARIVEWRVGRCLLPPNKTVGNTLLVVSALCLFASSRPVFAAKAPCDCDNPVAKTRLGKYAEHWRMRLEHLPPCPRRIAVAGTLGKMISSDEFLGLSQQKGGWAELDEDGEHFFAHISPYVFKELTNQNNRDAPYY